MLGIAPSLAFVAAAVCRLRRSPPPPPNPPARSHTHFFFEAEGEATRPWFFSWTFCVAACTIVSGCLAERTRLLVYPAFTVVIAALVHPLLVHWVWSHDSWIAGVSACRPLDFAGGTVVHMIGGLFGIVGAAFVGPRLGRFEEGAIKDLPGHDMGWVTIGTLALWWAEGGRGAGFCLMGMTMSGEAGGAHHSSKCSRRSWRRRGGGVGAARL